MNRAYMEHLLFASDIKRIKEEFEREDYSFFWSICSGDGFIQYGKMTVNELKEEINDAYLLDDKDVVKLANKLYQDANDTLTTKEV